MKGRPGPSPARGETARLLPWYEGAACAGHPEPDLWFSEEPAGRARARQICRGCPARAGCFIAAVARGEEYGTWGGRNFEGRRYGQQVRAAAKARTDGPSSSAEQLGLPLVLASDPQAPARWVAAFCRVPVEEVQAAIDAGALPARYDGEQWLVPLWAVPTFARTVA
jgi:hypothetical protein